MQFVEIRHKVIEAQRHKVKEQKDKETINSVALCLFAPKVR